MGNEDGITNEYFEARSVSRGEFEALKRFGDYEELSDGTLMRGDVQRTLPLNVRQNSCRSPPRRLPGGDR